MNQHSVITHALARAAHKYENVASALAEAEGQERIDYLIAYRGDAKRPSQYAPTFENLKAALFRVELRPELGDRIFVWLPQDEV